MKDIRNDLGNVLKTGKSVTGFRQVEKTLLVGNPKLIILSRNCPTDEMEQIMYYAKIASVPCEVAKEDSMELGSVCGKPFPVSAISILDEGESNILADIKK
jgi:large subunit ribosomal protein L30e